MITFKKYTDVQNVQIHTPLSPQLKSGAHDIRFLLIYNLPIHIQSHIIILCLNVICVSVNMYVFTGQNKKTTLSMVCIVQA